VTDQPDETRDLVLRAYEADPRPVTFDPSDGLAQRLARSAESATTAAAAGYVPAVRQDTPSTSDAALVAADLSAGHDAPYMAVHQVEISGIRRRVAIRPRRPVPRSAASRCRG